MCCLKSPFWAGDTETVSDERVGCTWQDSHVLSDEQFAFQSFTSIWIGLYKFLDYDVLMSLSEFFYKQYIAWFEEEVFCFFFFFFDSMWFPRRGNTGFGAKSMPKKEKKEKNPHLEMGCGEHGNV